MPHIDEGRLHAYVDGECPEHERDAIERHLAVCEACRARAEAVRTSIAEATGLLGHLEPDPLQPPPWREIEERAAARRRGSGTRRRRRRVPASLAWAASIMVAFGAGWLAHSTGLTPGEPAPPFETRVTTSGDRDRPPPERPAEAPAGDAEPDAAVAEMEAAERPVPAGAARTTERPLPPEGRPTAETGAGEDDRTAEAVRGRDEERRAGTAGEREQDSAAAQTPRIAEALESELRRIRGERRVVADEPLRERAAARRRVEVTPPADEGTAAGATGDGARWLRVTAEEAAAWLGGPLRRLPDLDLVAIEVGPGGTLEGSVPGRPIVRVVYTDAHGSEITLTQQRVSPRADVSAETSPSGAEPSASDAPTPSETPMPRAAEAPSNDVYDGDDPALRVHPSGTRTYGWLDEDYRLALTARAEPDSLRALADRVR